MQGCTYQKYYLKINLFLFSKLKFMYIKDLKNID